MSAELVINAASHETRIALIENGTIAELYIERSREKGIVGNIYKGRVVRVLPGMQAAFVDIGMEKAAFLYVADVFDAIEEYESLLDDAKKDREESTATSRRRRIPISAAASHRGPAPGGAGTARAGIQGADRHQGGPHHLAHLPAGPAPGLHADGRSCRHLAPDRG